MECLCFGRRFVNTIHTTQTHHFFSGEIERNKEIKIDKERKLNNQLPSHLMPFLFHDVFSALLSLYFARHFICIHFKYFCCFSSYFPGGASLFGAHIHKFTLRVFILVFGARRSHIHLQNWNLFDMRFK